MKTSPYLFSILLILIAVPTLKAQDWFETNGFSGSITFSYGNISIRGDKDNPDVFERTFRQKNEMKTSLPEIGFYIGYGFRETYTAYIHASFGYYDESLDSYGTVATRDFGVKYAFKNISDVFSPYVRGGFSSNITEGLQTFNPENNLRSRGKYTARGQHLAVGLEVPFSEFFSGNIDFSLRRLPLEPSRQISAELDNPMYTKLISFRAIFYFSTYMDY
jgi:hypothetical protein